MSDRYLMLRKLASVMVRSANRFVAAEASLSRVRVEDWREDDRGWAFRVVVARAAHEIPRDNAREHTHDVHLSFRDHDYWCGGRLAPAELLVMILEYALAHYSGDWPGSFDAARVRRWLPGVDRDFHSALGRPS